MASVSETQLTSEQIDRLVATFYARIRKHEVLGPVFMRAVGDDDENWCHHEARIASFWRNASGLDRSFSGNPMRKHLANPEIVAEQFPVWLGLFRKTAEDVLPQAQALQIADLADRIGRSLSMGLVQFRGAASGPPRFDQVS